MFQRPVLLPTAAQDETFAGLMYHLDGELVPALTVEITPAHSVYFEHHILLWKHPGVQIGFKSLRGLAKRRVRPGNASNQYTGHQNDPYIRGMKNLSISSQRMPPIPAACRHRSRTKHRAWAE